MKLYCGIDLHSNNSVVVILDEVDKVVYQEKLNNELALILEQLSIYKDKLAAIAIESTMSWHLSASQWSDGNWLYSKAGPHRCGPNIQRIKTHTDDEDDAGWLDHLLRLKIFPTGYIYPKEERAVRDLLRKRSQLVRQSTTNILSLQNILARNTAQPLSSYKIKCLMISTLKSC